MRAAGSTNTCTMEMMLNSRRMDLKVLWYGEGVEDLKVDF